MADALEMLLSGGASDWNATWSRPARPCAFDDERPFSIGLTPG
jgi:hypothetical protein